MKKTVVVALLLMLLAGCTGPETDSGEVAETGSEKQPVVFIHGGAIDDYVAYLLLTTMEDVDLQGVVLTNTDSVSDYAMLGQWKMQSLLGREDDPVGLSAARGWNPFPWFYRADSVKLSNLEMFGSEGANSEWPPYPSGDELLGDILSQAAEDDEPVTVLLTCPMTTVSDLLREHPEYEAGVERLIWMGGAIDVKGNLDPSTIPTEVANPEAEWNVFWDPEGVEWVLENTSFPVLVLPLDVTNQAKLAPEFKSALAEQAGESDYSELVDQAYGLIEDEPFYAMWNTAAAVYVTRPDLFEEPRPMQLSVVVEGYSQGAIRKDDGGRDAAVVFNLADKPAFYEYVLSQFDHDFDE